MALIGWWSLDGNTEDYTVNQNHGVNNDVTWVDGKIGQAGSFNGSNSTVNLGNSVHYNMGDEFSISVWINPLEQSSSYNGIISKTAGNASGYEIRTTTSDITTTNLQFRVMNGADTSISTSVNNNEWTHLTTIFKNQSAYFYKNGIYVSSSNLGINLPETVSNNLYIGKLAYTGLYFKGLINDVRIYDHALSQKEINDLARAKVLHYTFNKDENVVYDSSGYKRNGNKIGLTYSNNSKLGDGTYFSPNSTSGIVSKTFTTPAHITQSLWIYPTQLLSSSTPTYQNFLNETNDSLNLFYHKDSDYLFWKLIWSDGSSAYRVQIPGNLITPNEWHHIAATFDGVSNKIYLDGTLISSNTPPFTEIRQYNTQVHVFKENDSFTGGFENGYIDDLQIYATALSESDILDLYQTRIKIDNEGNLYTNEIVEDYEIAPNTSLNSQYYKESNSATHSSFIARSSAILDKIGDYARVLATIQHGYISQNLSLTTGKKYYVAGSIKTTSSLVKLVSYNGASDMTAVPQKLGEYTLVSNYITCQNSIVDNPYVCQYRDSRPSGWDYYYVRDTVFIEVTDIFGAGSEPEKEQLDAWYKDYITSRPKSSGIVKTREFSEIDNIDEPMKIFKDKIQIQGSIKEG